jgi:hypothetical protein
MVAVTFEVVSLHTNTLSESVFAQLKTFLECSAGWSSHVPECQQCLKICGPSKWSSVLGIARRCTGPNLANMVKFHYRFFDQKLLDSERVMSKGIVMMQRSRHRAKVRVFSDEQPHVTLPIFPNNSAGSLFSLVQETQSEQFSSDW